MAKVPVTVLVDPNVETTIKPFAAQVAKDAVGKGGDSSDSWSATVTYNSGGPDADGTLD